MSSKAPSPVPLHEATDRLNGALLEAEDALCELNLGVPVSVPLEKGRELHFRKSGKAYALLVTRVGEDVREHVLCTSRETRLEVVRKLPALRDALIEAYENELRRVEGGIDEVHAFTASVQGLRRPP